MASMGKPSRFNLSDFPAITGDFDELGFQTDFQLSWREVPEIDNCRQKMKNSILVHLSRTASAEFKQQMAGFASEIERRLFSDAISQEDYMDQEKIMLRIFNMVRNKWYHTTVTPQRPTLDTEAFPMCTLAPSSTTGKSNFGINSNNPLDHVLSANVGNLFADSLNASCITDTELYGSRKRTFEATSLHPKQALPNYSSSPEGFSCGKPVYSGPTFSGSVLQYDSESSFESHHQRSQCLSEGDPNYFVSSNGSCSSVQAPSTVLEILAVSPVSGGVHVQQPFLESPRFCPSKLEVKSSSSCRAPVQNINSHTFQDTADRPVQTSHFSNRGDRICVAQDSMKPTKCRKLNPPSLRHSSSCDASGLSEPTGPCGPPIFEQQPRSPTVASFDNPEADMGMIADYVNGSKRISKASNGVVDEILGSNCKSPLIDFHQKMKSVAADELKDEGSGSLSNSPSDCVPSFCEDKCIAQNEEIIEWNDPEESEEKTSDKCHPPFVASLTEMKSEKQKVNGISLIDFFTAEEIRTHLSSIKQKADQGLAEEVVGSTANCSINENICQLCDLERLSFPPMPIYCSCCGGRVKDFTTYYSTMENQALFCFCTPCCNKFRGGSITIFGVLIYKKDLKLKTNNLVNDEPWVQCDKCEGWQHQICALFNDKRNLGGKAEYICPKCHLEGLGTGERITLPRSTSLDAASLPRTLLSDHLEQRLSRRLKQEIEDRAKATGQNSEEIPQAADLVVRVVSSVDKILQVKQQFLEIFSQKSYPAEFPYRSKVILLFQRIEGVDVCLFAMYVQEFGSECSRPNQRSVYISYLDSVKYFRPEAKTLKGEALRTFVYHEILLGYLSYCKKRGFATCYIWACPPVKGEDYILYGHPESQKTPNPSKLRGWYHVSCKKGKDEGIVVTYSNLYEKFFVSNGESNTKVTAARLPYFDGDYWSGVADKIIEQINEDCGGDPEKQIKKLTRRSLKALGHANPSATDARDILLMKALEKSIGSSKEDFIVVELQFACTHCNEIISSGKRWFCDQCKNFQLCERCYDQEQDSGQGDTHVHSSGHIHPLSQELVNDVPVDTEDNDAIMDNCFLENRHAFLNFCQGNHYQFDSLRHAKHSSMMILYHLHNPNGSGGMGTVCSLCLKNVDADPKWTCEMCPEFNVCSTCYQRNNVSCHIHKLSRHPPAAIIGSGSTKTKLVTELLEVLLHASHCHATMDHPCSYPNCARIRRLFCHTQACRVRVSGGCHLCKKAWFALSLHSQNCRIANCDFPRCMDIKENSTRLVK